MRILNIQISFKALFSNCDFIDNFLKIYWRYFPDSRDKNMFDIIHLCQIRYSEFWDILFLFPTQFYCENPFLLHTNLIFSSVMGNAHSPFLLGIYKYYIIKRFCEFINRLRFSNELW